MPTETLKKDNIQKMGGRRGIKKSIITAFISTGKAEGWTKYAIAKEAKVSLDDKEMMRHIETMMKRHDARKK